MFDSIIGIADDSLLLEDPRKAEVSTRISLDLLAALGSFDVLGLAAQQFRDSLNLPILTCFSFLYVISISFKVLIYWIKA